MPARHRGRYTRGATGVGVVQGAVLGVGPLKRLRLQQDSFLLVKMELEIDLSKQEWFPREGQI